MTRDDVIRMAREVWGYSERMTQDLLDCYDSGAAAEREAIAAHYAAHPHVEFFGRELADEIRARGPSQPL